MRGLKISEVITTRETESFKKYLRDVSNIDLFESPEVEAECAHRAINGDLDAQDELVMRNLRFVISVAKQYIKPNVTLEDLVNEGNIGLMEAATKFDPSQGTKFITYAVWYIRKDILKYLYINERQVRVPNNKLNDLNSLRKVVSEMEQTLSRPISMYDVLGTDGSNSITDKELITLIEVSNGHAQSIDTPINEDGSTMVELMESSEFEDNDFNLTNGESYKRLDQLLGTLDKNSATMLRMYYGIGYHYRMNLLEIGDIFNLSRERVRQIKDATLLKLNETAKGYDFNELTF